MPERPDLRLSPRAGVQVRARLFRRIQAAQLLSLSESETARLMHEIESDPLFERLLFASERRWKVLKFRAFPRTRLSESFYQPDQNSLAADTPADVVSILEEHRDAHRLIKKIGQERFERYFLRAEENVSPQELATLCGLSPAEAAKIRSFVLTFSVQAEFVNQPAKPAAGSVRVTRLARLEVMADGEVAMVWLSPHWARGGYAIDYERVKELLAEAGLAPAQKRDLKALLRRLEQLNWRQDTLFRILDFICHAQRAYLKERSVLKARPLTQRQCARRLQVAPSTVNRAVRGRSVVLPWGEERLLEGLFLSRQEICMSALEELESREGPAKAQSDSALREQLKEKLGIELPRRTVNYYRNLLRKGSAG